MQKRTLLPVALAGLSALSLATATAQAKKETSISQEKPTKASSTSSDPEAEVVGSINGKPAFTFGQFLAKFQRDNPPAFSAAVSSAIGSKAVASFFGPKAASSFTISKKELFSLMRKAPAQSLGSALGNYLSDQVLQETGTKAGAAPSDAQLDDFLNFLLRKARKEPNAGFTPGQTDEQFLKARNLTRAGVKKTLRTQQLIFNLLTTQMEGDLKHKLKPEDFVQARHILIKADPITDKSTPEQKKADADALAKITDIAAQIQSGKITFEKAAMDYSADGSAKTGGDLGIFMDDNTMVKVFQDAAFSQKPNEISKPVRSEFGYHLIQVTKAGKEISEDDRRDALIKRFQPKIGLFVATLSQNAKIVNKLMPPREMMMPGDGQ